MSDRHLFLLVFALSLANGLLSPAFPILLATAPIWAPDFIWHAETLDLRRFALFHMASFLVAFATLALAGVPAALLERFGPKKLQRATLSVWLAAVVVLMLPALTRFL